jgi:prevent-host-death family protein
MKRYSITTARNKLSALVRDLNDRNHIELTSHGQPVAVMLSMSAYRYLSSPKVGFWDAYQRFRQSHSLEQLNIEPDDLSDVRDSSPGREVHF